MSEKNIKVSDITIGKRHRKEFGDIDQLAESMKALSLLHPIGVTPDNVLIFGQRRLMAAEKLGWDTIRCSVIDISSIVAGEEAENEVRLDFTLSERDAVRKAVLAHIDERRGGDRKSPKAKWKNQSGQLTTLIHDEPKPGEKTREFAAKKAGFPSEAAARRVASAVASENQDLIKAMDEGKISPTKADLIARLEKKDQPEELARAISGLSDTTKKRTRKQKKEDGEKPDPTATKTIRVKVLLEIKEKLEKLFAMTDKPTILVPVIKIKIGISELLEKVSKMIS